MQDYHKMQQTMFEREQHTTELENRVTQLQKQNEVLLAKEKLLRNLEIEFNNEKNKAAELSKENQKLMNDMKALQVQQMEVLQQTKSKVFFNAFFQIFLICEIV